MSARFAAFVPNGTVKVVLNLTLASGAGGDASAAFSSCRFTLSGPVVGDGRTFGHDCGALAPGAAEAVVTLGEGSLSGRLDVDGYVMVRTA
jgi:hypothetical protein